MRDGERTACWDYRQGGNRAAQFGAETEGQGNEHGAGVGSKKLAPASCFWPGSGPGSFAIYSVAYHCQAGKRRLLVAWLGGISVDSSEWRGGLRSCPSGRRPRGLLIK